jgi:hypothetical protein
MEKYLYYSFVYLVILWERMVRVVDVGVGGDKQVVLAAHDVLLHLLVSIRPRLGRRYERESESMAAVVVPLGVR